MSYQSFETLEVWKKARCLKIEIFKLTKAFPSCEKYRLIDQMIRSSRSVNAQIAEGHGRRTDPEKLRYCIVARGSLSELLNHMIDAYDSDYIDEETLKKYRLKIKVVESVLNGYIAYLEKKIS